MLSLDTATKSLEVKLAGAVATAELPFVCSYVDIDQASFLMTGSSGADGVTAGAVAVEAVAAPAASTTRKLNYLSLVNVDTAPVIATVQVNNNGTKRACFTATLQVGDQLSFTDARGWSVFDANGNAKTSYSGGPTALRGLTFGGASVAYENTAYASVSFPVYREVNGIALVGLTFELQFMGQVTAADTAYAELWDRTTSAQIVEAVFANTVLALVKSTTFSLPAAVRELEVRTRATVGGAASPYNAYGFILI
ncbi:MAG TPA: hypothetical protein VMZ92_13345 [Planctomycetota bacterium]|nr:hypothetical protein [Planctomycetota bacterium]